MPASLDQLSSLLAAKILNADGDTHASNHIEAAVNGLKNKKTNGYLIVRFVDKTVSKLVSLPSSKMTYKQWNIVKRAVLQLGQMRAQCSSASLSHT